MIRQTEISIPAPAGAAEAVVVADADDTPRPGVLMLTDIRGIRPSQLQMAEQLAGAGYTVLLPNVFYRTCPLPLWSFPMDFAEPRTQEHFRALRAPLTPAAIAEDGRAWIDMLRAQPATAPGPLGVVGYCATGAVAMHIAAAHPDDVAAVASFHGGWLYGDAEDSPHRVLPKIRARLYFGFAVNDRTMPDDAVAALKEELKTWGGTWSSDVYAGALHGWTVPDSAQHHPEQAKRAFEALTKVLAG